MEAYILTAIAGIVCGLVGMRLWQNYSVAKSAPGGEVAVAGGEETASTPAPIGRTRLILIGAGVLAVLAIAVSLLRGGEADNGAAAMASPAAPAMAGQQNLADVGTMIDQLAARLKENPNDGEGFRMLGWSYLMTDRPKEALEPYRKALALLPDDASVHSGYGEALVAVANEKVTPEARSSFEKALKIDPSEPRARYFMALYDAQNGKQKQALDTWIALVNSSPPDAPWQADVRRKIDETARALGVDVSGQIRQAAPAPAAGAPAMAGQPPALDPATVQAARQLPANEQEAMIDGMVEGLAARLAANPKNPEGWARLIRSRMVRGQRDKAASDLVTARKALAGDAAGLATVNATASEMGVPGA